MRLSDETKARLSEPAPRRLFVLLPTMRDDPVVRTMLLSVELRELIEGPWQSDGLEYRAGMLRADLEEFVKGETLTVCLEPFCAKSAYMGRLAPTSAGLWDIGSRDPRP